MDLFINIIIIDQQNRNQTSLLFMYSKNIITKQYKDGVYFGNINDKTQPHQWGIFIYDNGDFGIYQLQHNMINGNFFYFQSVGKGVCFYGSIKNKKVHGTNFAYTKKNSFLKVQFSDGIPVQQQGYYIKSTSKQQIIKNGHIFTEKVLVQQTNFIKPTDFLLQFFHNQISLCYSFYNQDGAQTPHQLFQVYDLGNDQVYFGIIFNGKPHGYGIIFLNQWPVCYGYFEEGHLAGLGRIYENSFTVIDGLFEKSKLIEGWIFNLKEQKTNYRVLKREENLISYEFKGLDYQTIKKTRRNFHLSSLFYENNYCMNGNFAGMWPKNLLSQITFDQILQDIMSNFNPSHLSQIQRIPEMSENDIEKDLIDLLHEHHDTKESHIHISKILEERLKKYEQQTDQTMGKDKKNDRMLLKDNKWSIPQNKKIDLHQIYKTYLRK